MRRPRPDRPKVRRFSPTEIAYHWAQALPWLVCAVTGGLLLAHAGGTGAHSREAAGRIHRYAGAAFLIGTALVFLAGDRRRLLANLRSAVTLRREDLRWLLLSPLAALGLPVSLPPAGRMNPGQKLNLLAQALLLPVFGATGLAMWLTRGGLIVWFLHVAAFAVALPLVLGHLYLALVNPGTRRGLRGMFDGRVDREWAAHHHPRWVPPAPEAADRTAPAPRRVPVFRLVLVAALVASGAALATILRRDAGLDLPTAMDRVQHAVEPGPLSAPHRRVPALADCGACHDATGDPPDAKCTGCHEKVAAARTARAGWHGKLTGRCSSCHGEHHGAALVRFDRAAFNHHQARFDLKGAHRDLTCDRCHSVPAGDGTARTRWQGIPHSSCTDCHSDPHDGTLGADCTKCHSESGFTGRNLRFVHRTDSDFALVGAHARLACSQCHAAPPGGGPPRYTATPRTCAGCHEDPHRPGFDRACTDCHGTEAWTGRDLRFEHDADTRFPLTGRHRELACTRCHEPASPGAPLAAAAFAATPSDCAGCHRTPHGPDLPLTCAECHTTAGFSRKALALDHSRFPLTGSHAGVACERCHVPARPGGALASARFRGLANGCADCHEDPHRGRLAPAACADCHSPTEWDRTAFDHDRVFVLDGNHRKLDCAACHRTKEFRVKSRSCEGCHDDVAGDQAGRGTGAADPLPADPHRGKVGCADCHFPSGATRRLPAMAAACTKCHAPSYAGLLVDRMGRVAREMAEIDLAPALTPKERGQAARLARIARHDYVPAERRLRRLAAGGKEGE